MLQKIIIDSTETAYSLTAKNIISVLGKVVIYKTPTFEDLQAIVYLGLDDNHGYTLQQFRGAYGRTIYFSKTKNHYFFTHIRALVQKRIHEINREYLRTHTTKLRHR